MKRDFVNPAQWQEIAGNILKNAKKKGASHAETACSISEGFTVNVRLAEVETIEYHRDKGVDITVYFGFQSGSASTTDINPQSIENAVSAACSIAKATGSDDCHGLADAEFMARHYPDLDLYYPWPIDVDQAIDLAKICENKGRSHDSRITNSEGASVSQHTGFYLYANTHEFMGNYFSSRHSLQCVLLAESQGNKERDYEFTVARDPKELMMPEEVGEKAAKKTLARLEAQKLSTRQTAVIFAPPVACGLIGHLVGAIRGHNIYRESSFLLHHLGKTVFPEYIDIMENPHIPKALGSAPFDGEGVFTRPQVFIEKGVLKGYILDSYSARKLKMKPTGNAGGVHNLLIQPTLQGGLDDLLKTMDTGLLVTEVMGQGVNIVTGDYSRGAAGFWVEKGQIQYPVHEITIAGNLRDMFLHLAAAGSDVDKRGGVWSGSLLIENMTIAGE
jgi:PmbA protein